MAVVLTRNLRRFSTEARLPDVVFIDGVRTPFLRAGTAFAEMMPHDLGREAILGLLKRTNISADKIGYVAMGTVVQEARTSNVARESVIAAGLPWKVPAHTVTMACISGNVAATSCIGMLRDGAADVCIAGGVEVMSDAPIRLNRNMRRAVIEYNKAKSLSGRVRSVVDALKEPGLEVPARREFSTGEIMGHSADRMAASFGVTRAEQDEFASRSHQMAAQAAADGHTATIPVTVGGKVVTNDNGVRTAGLDRLPKLSPAFIRPHGTVTAGNASFLTDGASAGLLMTSDAAQALGLKPKARLRQYVYVSQDPTDQLLLGPAYATAALLDQCNMSVSDVDVWEIHEAFAAQVLANLRALDSDWFAVNHMGRKAKVGELPMEKINRWGGSLSIGHPFGATGVRLLTHAADRLAKEDGQIAVVTACAAGGQGVAMVVERC